MAGKINLTPEVSKLRGQSPRIKEILVDLVGLYCPNVQIKTVEAINSVPSGVVLKILITDASGVESVVSISRNSGHEIMGVDYDGEIYTIKIKKK